jgi:hypothetical protein
MHGSIKWISLRYKRGTLVILKTITKEQSIPTSYLNQHQLWTTVLFYCCSFSPLKRFYFYMTQQGEQLYGIEVSPVNTGGCWVQSATILITPFNHPRRQTSPYKNALLLMVCYYQFSYATFRLLWCNIAPHEENKMCYKVPTFRGLQEIWQWWKSVL